MEEYIIFDDWSLRPNGVTEQRKKDYLLCLIPLCFLNLFSLVLCFFYLAPLVFFIISLIALAILFFEYLKLKNAHLVITEEAFYVTNRFGKTKKYLLSYKNCSIVLAQSAKRGGGIWLKFYDQNKTLIFRYEDMLNIPALHNGQLTSYGKALSILQIPIQDPNDLFHKW